jgi:hypothetical protein
LNNHISFHDSILDGITYNDLITTIQSNEKEINEQTVQKVFSEILNSQLEDAKNLLKENMSRIVELSRKKRGISPSFFCFIRI